MLMTWFDKKKVKKCDLLKKSINLFGTTLIGLKDVYMQI